MSHLSLTRAEIATLILLVEKGSSLHRKLSNQFGDREVVGYLYPSLREITMGVPDPEYRYRRVILKTNMGDKLVYIEECK